MMRKNLRLAYFLFQAVLVLGSTIYFRDLTIATALMSIIFAEPLYERLHREHRFQWLIPYGIVAALALGGFYYVADFWAFPHSAHALHRLRDACANGILWSLGAFWMAWAAVEIEGRRHFPRPERRGYIK